MHFKQGLSGMKVLALTGLLVGALATVGIPQFEVHPNKYCEYGYWVARPLATGFSCGPTACTAGSGACSEEGVGTPHASWINAQCAGSSDKDCTLRIGQTGDAPKLNCEQESCDVSPGVQGYKCKWVMDASTTQTYVGLKKCFVN